MNGVFFLRIIFIGSFLSVSLSFSLSLAANAQGNAQANDLPPIPFSDSSGYLDIRGVGDAGWARNGEPIDQLPLFEERLRDFDPNGEILLGDLNFINWESSLAEECTVSKNKYVKKGYSFISHPEAFEGALNFGYNLFNLTNNHSRDCYQVAHDEEVSYEQSEKETLQIISKLSDDYDFVFHGMGKNQEERFSPKVFNITKDGQEVTLAFNGVYAHYHNRPTYCQRYSNCFEHADEIMRRLQNSNADIKILSIHSQGEMGYRRSQQLAQRFIFEFNGDLVLAHGTHSIKAVKVVKKANGYDQGVIFEDLGNFLHPGIRGHHENMLGRILVDLQTKKIIQIQAVTLRGIQGRGVDGFIKGSHHSAENIPANFDWLKPHNFLTNGYGDDMSWAYYNLPN